MKILYLKTTDPSLKHINDFLHDTLLVGLRNRFGDSVVDYPGAWYMYKDECEKKRVEQKSFWGKGFTLYNILGGYDKIDREYIQSKIKNNYFDYIIYGSIRGKNLFYEDVLKSKSKKAFIDTSDDPNIDNEKLDKGLYFKRELYQKYKNIFPINFAIPAEKIIKNTKNETKFILSPLIPGKIDTYQYEEETKYFEMYQSSLFSLTYKKTGWDCLRHYEILASGSIPLFLDLEKCPEDTCTTLPKNDLRKIYNEFSWLLSFYNPFKVLKKRYRNLNAYKNYLARFFSNLPSSDEFLKKYPIIQEHRNNLLEFTKKKLTSEMLAENLVNTLKKY